MHRIIKVIIFMIVMHSLSLSCVDSVFILIHGTWGLNSDWYVPGGGFFDTLEKIVSERKSAVVPFCWNGGCGQESRLRAAHNLVKLIQSYDTTVAIYIIAHSHGGNVATLASQLLSHIPNNKYRIRALYALGTPIMETCLPNMDSILYVYNLFSFEDLVQPLLGMSQRVYPEHRRIANMRVFIEGKEPGHTALHDSLIAQWLPFIHQQFKNYLRQKNIINTIAEPSIIYFYYTKAPEYTCDKERRALIEKDYQLSVLIVDSLRNSLDIGSRIPLTNR